VIVVRDFSLAKHFHSSRFGVGKHRHLQPPHFSTCCGTTFQFRAFSCVGRNGRIAGLQTISLFNQDKIQSFIMSSTIAQILQAKSTYCYYHEQTFSNLKKSNGSRKCPRPALRLASKYGLFPAERSVTGGEMTSRFACLNLAQKILRSIKYAHVRKAMTLLSFFVHNRVKHVFIIQLHIVRVRVYVCVYSMPFTHRKAIFEVHVRNSIDSFCLSHRSDMFYNKNRTEWRIRWCTHRTPT
jgi:hypothetical protein